MARDFLPSPICASALRAVEDVEDGDGVDERLVGGAGGLEDGVGLGAGVEDEGEVALDGLEVGGARAAGRVVARARGSGRASRWRVKATAGPFTSRAARMRGWSSPKLASGVLWPRERVAERPGWNQAGAVRWRMRAAGAPMAASAASASARASQRSTGRRVPCGLRGAVAPVRRPAAWSDCSPGSPPGKAWPISKRARSAEAAGLVAGGGAQEAGEEVGAEVAHLGGDGVLEAHGVGAAAEEGGGGAVDEAVGDGLVEAEGGDAAAGLALAALGGGEDGLRHAGGAGEGAALELRRARRRGRSPRRGRPRPGRRGARWGARRRGRRRVKPRAVEDAGLLGLGDVHADEAGDAGGVEAVAAARCRGRRRRRRPRRARRRRGRGSWRVASSMPRGVKAGSTPRSKR